MSDRIEEIRTCLRAAQRGDLPAENAVTTIHAPYLLAEVQRLRAFIAPLTGAEYEDRLGSDGIRHYRVCADCCRDEGTPHAEWCSTVKAAEVLNPASDKYEVHEMTPQYVNRSLERFLARRNKRFEVER